MKLRIIGDVHGRQRNYAKLAERAEYSVQVGDMGLNYFELTHLVDERHHRFVPGNHDNYDSFPAHALPNDYGVMELGDTSFMYIRGADSVDKQYRTIGVSWWEDEEISWQSGLELIKFVIQHKPSLIISHDCPYCIYPSVLTNPDKWTPSRTAQILDAVFQAHQPDVWVFGHHHRDALFPHKNTEFVCLNELSYIDYPDLTIHKYSEVSWPARKY